MPRSRKAKLAGDFDDKVTVQPFRVDEAQKLFDALDCADDEAEGPKQMRQAAVEAIKNKGYLVDAFKTVQKLRRKKSVIEAQAWLEAVQLYAQAAGILDQTDLFRSFTAKAEPSAPSSTTLN